jgi:two-component system nitrogen regulation response regulator NtrX
LGNAVERLMILYPDRVIAAPEIATVLPRARLAGPEPVEQSGSLSDMLESYERQLIQSALAAGGGNIAEAARRLNTDRPNLYRRMKRLGIRREGAEDDLADL